MDCSFSEFRGAVVDGLDHSDCPVSESCHPQNCGGAECGVGDLNSCHDQECGIGDRESCHVRECGFGNDSVSVGRKRQRPDDWWIGRTHHSVECDFRQGGGVGVDSCLSQECAVEVGCCHIESDHSQAGGGHGTGLDPFECHDHCLVGPSRGEDCDFQHEAPEVDQEVNQEIDPFIRLRNSDYRMKRYRFLGYARQMLDELYASGAMDTEDGNAEDTEDESSDDDDEEGS